MSQQWYFITGGDGNQQGPVELPHLMQMVDAGSLKPDDLVWNAEMPQFTPASGVQALFSGPIPAKPVVALDYAAVPKNSYAAQDPMANPLYTGPRAPVIYAGFFLRLLAYLVDGVILAMIMIPVLIGFVWMIGALDELTPAGLFAAFKAIDGNPIAGLTLRLVIAGVVWLYFAYQESSAAQATLGKRVLGLVVTDTSGQRISFARATGRHLGKIISSMILALGYIVAGISERKQALHDMMAGCLVVLKPN